MDRSFSPRPRAGACFFAVGRRLYVAAGFCGHELNDVHSFDLASREWRLESEGTFSARSVCSYGVVTSPATHETSLIIVGGELAPSARGHQGAGNFGIYYIRMEESPFGCFFFLPPPPFFLLFIIFGHVLRVGCAGASGAGGRQRWAGPKGAGHRRAAAGVRVDQHGRGGRRRAPGAGGRPGRIGRRPGAAEFRVCLGVSLGILIKS
jgi:hypothetical protein